MGLHAIYARSCIHRGRGEHLSPWHVLLCTAQSCTALPCFVLFLSLGMLICAPLECMLACRPVCLLLHVALSRQYAREKAGQGLVCQTRERERKWKQRQREEPGRDESHVAALDCLPASPEGGEMRGREGRARRGMTCPSCLLCTALSCIALSYFVLFFPSRKRE